MSQITSDGIIQRVFTLWGVSRRRCKMHHSKLTLATLALLWVATINATIILTGVTTGLVLGGLAVLKGATLLGYAIGKKKGLFGRHFFKRSADEVGADDQAEERLLSTVVRLDQSGCILKLLCHLQFKEESSRTPEEEVLVQMFGNRTEALTAHTAAFVFASEIGNTNRDPAVCERYFGQCPFTGEEVGRLLQEAWACGVQVLQKDHSQD